MHDVRSILSIIALALLATDCGGGGGEQPAEVARPAKLFTVRASGDHAPRVFPGQVQAARAEVRRSVADLGPDS